MTNTDTSAEAHDWAELRRLAEAARRGPWKTTMKHPHAGGLRVVTSRGDRVADAAKVNAAYIAAAHPAAVLALLSRAERAEAERDAAVILRREAVEHRDAAMRGEIAARAEVERLRDALANYAEWFCELGPSHECCGKLPPHDCSGCRARAALAKEPGHE